MTRVLHVIRPGEGGAFRHVRALAEAQLERGYEVAVCGPHRGRADDLAFPVIDVEMGRSMSPVADVRTARDVAAVYRSFKPDLIHSHGSQAGVFARLGRVARREAPLVHTPHGYAFVNNFADSRSQHFYRGIERVLMPLATRVVCVCDWERELTLGLGAKDRKVSVVHNGIDPLEPAPAPEFVAGFVEPPAPLVVALAELRERKGISTLLEAFGDVGRSHPEARLIIAGEGPDREMFEVLRRRLGLDDRVLLPGHVDGVPGLLHAATHFVNPSWAESFSYAVLEAMSVGLPSVVTDVGGTAEAIENGISGIVVQPRDREALASGLRLLLDQQETAASFGAAARQRLLHLFTRERMVEGTLAVYGELGTVPPTP